MYSLRQLLLPIFRLKYSTLSMKFHVLAFSDIWPCRKNGQGQPKVIRWTILVELECQMLHTMFQGLSPLVLEKKIFKGFFPYMGVAAILIMWPNLLLNFHFHSPISFHMNFGSKSSNCFWEKQVLTLKSEWYLTKVKEWPWPLILT